MTEQKHQDGIEAQRLVDRTVATLTHHSDRTIAQIAMIQANLSQAANQALVTLLIRKNIVSQADVSEILAQAYRARADQLVGAGLIVPAAPQVKPNGHGGL